MKRELKVFLMFCVLLFPGIVYCGPVIEDIEGIISKGGEVVLKGYNFRAHNDYGFGDNYLCYIWEDCEKGVIDRGDKWSINGGGGFAWIDSQENRPGSRYNLFNERRKESKEYINAFGEDVEASFRYGVKTNVSEVAPVHKYFCSMWVMLSENFGLIQNTTDGTGTKLLMTTPFDERGGKDYFSVGRSDIGEPKLDTCTENGCQAEAIGAANDLLPFGTWHRLDMYISIPDETTNYTDTVKYWLDGKLVRDTQQHGLQCAILQPNPEDVHKIGLVSFLGYIYNGTDLPIYIRTDDLFLDFTQARVELANTPNLDFDEQIHSEIQIPIEWSDTQIKVQFNQGSFQEGDRVYLFVVDSDGNVSEGYPITIGQSYGQAEDVNQDGSVNISDVQLVVNVILGNATNSRADINGDGTTNVSDVQAVVNEIVD